MSARAGLVGMFQPPTLPSNGGNSVYMITDDNNDSLYIFILFPGAYDIAYEIASKTWYRNVFIIPVSLDALYVSDVTRLANDLSKIKFVVRVLFPGKFCAYVPTVVQRALIDSGRKTYYRYKNGIIAFDYKFEADTDYQPNFHDIFATFRTRRCLFVPFEVKKERILKLLQNDEVDWVYVPYSDPMFGTDCYTTLVIDSDFKPYMNKIIAFGFFNQTQVNYCKGRYPNSFPRTIRAEFTRSDNTLENGNPPVVGGKATIYDDPSNPNRPENLPPDGVDVNHGPWAAPFPVPKPHNVTAVKVNGATQGEIHIIPKTVGGPGEEDNP